MSGDVNGGKSPSTAQISNFSEKSTSCCVIKACHLRISHRVDSPDSVGISMKPSHCLFLLYMSVIVSVDSPDAIADNKRRPSLLAPFVDRAVLFEFFL